MPDRQDGRRLLPRLTSWIFRHCEERSDAAIQRGVNRSGLIRSDRNDVERGGTGPDRTGYNSRQTPTDRNAGPGVSDRPSTIVCLTPSPTPLPHPFTVVHNATTHRHPYG